MKLSNKQAKTADRVGGIELMLIWPTDLPAPRRLAEDEERDATSIEDRRCREIIDQADLDARRLVQVRTVVAMVRRPPTVTLAPAEIRPHLVARIIGRRWVHATGRHQPPVMWASWGEI